MSGLNQKYRDKIKNSSVKILSILFSIVIIVVLIFTMPIVAYTPRDSSVVENVSIVNFVKNMQLLVGVEGNLDSVSVSDVNSEVVHEDFTDGLDLDQIIEGQYTILFLGMDELSANHDVNWICQFDIAKGTLNILQVPRDTFMGSDGSYASTATGKFNSVYSHSNDDGTSPIQRVVNTVQDNFGIPIDAYITTNCYDIVDIVDLIGGIPITLDETMMYEGDKIIPAGYNVLNGEQAEWFVRYRRTFGEGDIGRVKNQRTFLAAAMQKMLNIIEDEGQAKFFSYLKTIYENQYILTDLTIGEISMLADLASTIDMESVTVHLVPGEGAWYYPPSGGSEQSVWSVHKEATLDIVNEYFRPYQTELQSYNSALIELVTDYLNVSNDEQSANFSEIQNGEVDYYF